MKNLLDMEETEMTRKFTIDGATALLDMEPFFIFQIYRDANGYPDRDFPPIVQATNVLWDIEAIERWVGSDTHELGQELGSCIATYLCHIRYRPDNDAGEWDSAECELISVEPFEVAIVLEDEQR